MSKILIVDDEKKITRLLYRRISQEGHQALTFNSAEETVPVIREGDTDIILCDLKLGGMDGLELLKLTRELSPGTDFVIMTAYASTGTAVEAMQNGAYEYLIKPFQMDEVVMLINRIEEKRNLFSENKALREQVSTPGMAGQKIKGQSQAMARIRHMITMVASRDTPVLIQGESGTGKEIIAAEIHSTGDSSGSPFITLNCAAIPASLMEAEMFGHQKGAFTGAVQQKPGLFKLADGGTLFLDEIGEMPPGLQSKLLRAIENKEFRPVGGSENIRVRVRIIAATNRNLEELIEKGDFREDLYYRLNVFPIHVPPLRERKADIVPLSEFFLGQWNLPLGTLTAGAMEKLKEYHWPGNVRELKNILERAVILSEKGPIRPEHITISTSRDLGSCQERLKPLIGEKTLPEIEKTLIELAIRKSEGNKSKASKMLGITRRTLYSRMEKHGLSG